MGKEITIEILREVTERFIEAAPGRLGSEGWWQRPQETLHSTASGYISSQLAPEGWGMLLSYLEITENE